MTFLYGFAVLFVLALLWMLHSDRQVITKLKAENQSLHMAAYKKEHTKTQLENTAMSYQDGMFRAESDKKKVEAKLSDTLEKLRNLEEFFDRHQQAHKQHSEEKDLWEKEKRFVRTRASNQYRGHCGLSTLPHPHPHLSLSLSRQFHEPTADASLSLSLSLCVCVCVCVCVLGGLGWTCV